MESLFRLETFLAQAGASIVPTLRPGLDASQVAALLGELGLEPTAEFAAWFAWHDGSGARDVPREVVEIVPGGELYDLAYLCSECRQTRTIAEELAASPGWTLGDAHDRWPATWFPLLTFFGKGYLAVDLAGGPDALSPVHVVWHDASHEERARVAWPSIQAFVETMIVRFESGEYWVDDDGIVRGDSIDYPGDPR